METLIATLWVEGKENNAQHEKSIQSIMSSGFLQILSLPPPPFFSLLTQPFLLAPQCFGFLFPLPLLSLLTFPAFILRILSFIKVIKLLLCSHSFYYWVSQLRYQAPAHLVLLLITNKE
uniref:Uncharacterized protein n=1 Tax=Arundo donax TaxID=35708 RepID=A0A0A9GLK6_ARUDO